MILFLFRHWKATIAITSAIVAPLAITTWGFIVTTTRTNAEVPLHNVRLQALENSTYRIDERFKFIQRSLEVIQEREYNELKRARQLSQENK